MADFEEETYSTVFTSLKHPLRRKILRTLSAGPQSFTDLQRASGMESPHLTYHLEGLGSLLIKTDDGKYALSALGLAAVSMMEQAEEPRNRAFPRVSFSPRKWKLLIVALAMGIIVLSAAFIFEYQNLTLPSNQRSSMVDKYVVDGSVETAISGNEASQINCTFVSTRQGHVKMYSFRTLADNSTIEIEVQTSGSGTQEGSIFLTLYADTIHPAIAYVGTLNEISDPLVFNASQETVKWAHSYEKIWESTANNHSKYSISLQSERWYFIVIEGSTESSGNDYHEIRYAMTLQIQYQESYVPFLIGNEQEGYYPLLLP